MVQQTIMLEGSLKFTLGDSVISKYSLLFHNRSNQIKVYFSSAPNTTGVVDLTVKCLHSPDDKTRRKMFFLFTYDGVPWVVRLPEWGSLAEKRLKTTALDYSIFEDDMCRTILSVPISFLQQLIVTGSGTFPSPESVVYSIISC